MSGLQTKSSPYGSLVLYHSYQYSCDVYGRGIAGVVFREDVVPVLSFSVSNKKSDGAGFELEFLWHILSQPYYAGTLQFTSPYAILP